MKRVSSIAKSLVFDSKGPLYTKLTLMNCSTRTQIIAFTLNQQMAPQYIPIWAVAVEAEDFKLIME